MEDTSTAPLESAQAQPAAPAKRASVRMYRQGLGDCLFVSLEVPGKKPFRIMIDCGLVLGGKAKPGAEIATVMNDIVTTMEGDPLDLLIVTHPHWDHVSGFIRAADDFAKLQTKAVWMAWTENAQDEQAKRLSKAHQAAEQSLRQAVVKMRALGMGVAAGRVDSLLDFLGADGKNTTRGAMKRAAEKAPGGSPHYCEPGEVPTSIDGTDARIFVLGPPRDEARLRKMDPSAKNPETYSLAALNGLQAMAAALSRADDMPDDEAPFTASFAIPFADAQQMDFFRKHYVTEIEAWRKIDGDWLEDTTTFALLLDRAVNNSSLAIAIELESGGDVLLFAADAQVGNWLSWLKLEWNLDGRRVTGPDLIARTVLYKVGHHASLNATLAKDGVEKMARLEVAMVPVDAQSAIDKKWGHNIPFPKLLDDLKIRAKRGVFRSDIDSEGDRVTATPLYFEADF